MPLEGIFLPLIHLWFKSPGVPGTLALPMKAKDEETNTGEKADVVITW
jgi:hypothetical protein